jgi:hypothetical protein
MCCLVEWRALTDVSPCSCFSCINCDYVDLDLFLSFLSSNSIRTKMKNCRPSARLSGSIKATRNPPATMMLTSSRLVPTFQGLLLKKMGNAHKNSFKATKLSG